MSVITLVVIAITSTHRKIGVNVVALVNIFLTSSVKCFTANSHLKIHIQLHPYPRIHTCFLMIASNVQNGPLHVMSCCGFCDQRCVIKVPGKLVSHPRCNYPQKLVMHRN